MRGPIETYEETQDRANEICGGAIRLDFNFDHDRVETLTDEQRQSIIQSLLLAMDTLQTVVNRIDGWR